MNYSFNADYREVAKRMHDIHPVAVAISIVKHGMLNWTHLFNKYVKWPWC